MTQTPPALPPTPLNKHLLSIAVIASAGGLLFGFDTAVIAGAFRLDIPFTAHPIFGHDIIYMHLANDGASIGWTALRDFLTYAEQVSHLEGGVYLSIGSAVMSGEHACESGRP